MNRSIITIPSYWGIELKQKYIQFQEHNSKLVVLFPGKNYPCELPLLYYAGSAALKSGYDLLSLEYGYQAARTSFEISDLHKVIEESEESINQIIHNYKQIIFISKSLGTVVAGEINKNLKKTIKHIYLTPLKDTLPFINSTDSIVIYGGKDEVFSKEMAEQIELTDTRKKIEIANANHGLETNNIEENLSILRLLVNTYMEFLRP